MSERKKIKVVQISSVHPSFDTRIFHKICKSLVKEGYDVDLIIQHQKDEVLHGVAIKALPKASRKWDRVLRIIPILFSKCIKYPHNTVFHFHDPELLFLGFFMKWAGYKVVYDVHEDVPKDIDSKKWLPSFVRKYASAMVSWLERHAKSYFDGTVVVTRSIENRLKGDHTVLIQNFPIIKEQADQHSEEVSGAIPGSNKKVFYLGDITLIRGLREDIQALEYVNRTTEVEFILGGKFSPPSLQEELQKEPGWNYVNFVGWVNKQDFETYTGQSFAGLVTFHPEPNHIEAQPNKLFEYMYAGLPVVASDFPLWSEIVEGNECGLLVDPLDPEEIGEAILWLYNNPDEAKKMGENGHKAVLQKYNWDTEEKKLLQLYHTLTTN